PGAGVHLRAAVRARAGVPPDRDDRFDPARPELRLPPDCACPRIRVCRLPAVYVLEPTEPNVAPHFVPLEGCSIGRRVVWPEQRAYGVELRVDGRLDAGQVVSFAYRVELSAQATDMTAVVYSLPRRANDVLIEAEFRGDRRPVDCRRYQRTEAGETTAAVRLDRRDRLQVSEARFGPGTLGLRWAWEDDCGDETDEADGDEHRLGEGIDPIV